MKRQKMSLAVALALGAFFGSTGETAQSATIKTGASSILVDIKSIEVDKMNPDYIEYSVGAAVNAPVIGSLPIGSDMTLVEFSDGEKTKRALVETITWRDTVAALEKLFEQTNAVGQASRTPVIHLAYAKAA